MIATLREAAGRPVNLVPVPPTLVRALVIASGRQRADFVERCHLAGNPVTCDLQGDPWQHVDSDQRGTASELTTRWHLWHR